MRILVVTVSLPRGPAEAFVLPELLEMVRQGHELLVVPTLPQGSVVHEEIAAIAASCRVRPLLDTGILAGAICTALRRPGRALRALATILRGRGVRVALKNLSVLPKALWMARLARSWQADHLHAYWLSTPSTLAMIASQVAGIPWSATGFRWDIAEDNLLAAKARSASFVRVADRAGAAEAGRLAGDPPVAPFVLHSGVELPPAPTWRPRAAPDGGGFRLLMPANFVEKKGHVYLVEALKILSQRGFEFSCDLAGTGPLEDVVRTLVTSAGLDGGVRFAGVLGHQDFQARLERGDWDLVVLPSIEDSAGEKEGIPVSLLEAMARGVPVLATATGGIPELLAGGAGVMIGQKDPGALADAIGDLAAAGDRRQELARRGRKVVEDEYGVTVVVETLVARMRACVKAS